MTARLLPPVEWPRLTGTELETVWPLLSPVSAYVIAVEDDAGVIVGCWALLKQWHMEGLWIAPAYRGKVSVARRLWSAMMRQVRFLGAPTVATAALTDDVRGMLETVGAVKLPGDHYSVPMESVCLQQ